LQSNIKKVKIKYTTAFIIFKSDIIIRVELITQKKHCFFEIMTKTVRISMFWVKWIAPVWVLPAT